MASRLLVLAKNGIKILLLIYIGFGAVLFIFQDKYIYLPDRTDFQDCPAFKDAQKISFGTSRGYLTKTSPDKVAVYYHGNAGRACDRDFLNSTFVGQGYSTLFVEYTGYAEKDGNAFMPALLKNVSDTVDFLKTQNFKYIVVAGESIGVGPATYHALHGDVNKLILITAYNNLASVASSRFPIYPIHLLFRNNFEPDKWSANYKGPVSIIIAENDEIIPNKLSYKLFEGIPSATKNINVVKNAGHNTIYEKSEFYTFLEADLK